MTPGTPAMLFGCSPVGPAELATTLLTRVGERAREFQKTMSEYRAWTKAVLAVLSDEGKHLGLEVYCHGAPDVGEWLLDCVWWAKNGERGAGMCLACESEWSDRPLEVSWDFQKLLCVKAPLKVVIYSGGPAPKHGSGIRKQLESDLLGYGFHVRGEEYLFVSLDVGGGYAHRVAITADGRMEKLEWELVEVKNRE